MAVTLVPPNCAVCGEAISVQDGLLNMRENPNYEQWKAEKAAREAEGPVVYDITDDIPAEQYEREWWWAHEGCGDEGRYPIHLARIDTPEKALGWVVHLSEKSWFEIAPFADEILKAFPGLQPLPV